MFRNSNSGSIPSNAALGESEMLVVVESLLKVDTLINPLRRSIVDYIVGCTNEDLLCGLAKHANPEVRCAVASNQNLPEHLFWKLAEDRSLSVRAKLAENVHLEPFLLEALEEDEDDRISQRASRTLDKVNSKPNKVIHWMFGASFRRIS